VRQLLDLALLLPGGDGLLGVAPLLTRPRLRARPQLGRLVLLRVEALANLVAPLAQSFLRTSVPGVLLPGPIFPVPPVLSAGASALFVAASSWTEPMPVRTVTARSSSS